MPHLEAILESWADNGARMNSSANVMNPGGAAFCGGLSGRGGAHGPNMTQAHPPQGSTPDPGGRGQLFSKRFRGVRVHVNFRRTPLTLPRCARGTRSGSFATKAGRVSRDGMGWKSFHWCRPRATGAIHNSLGDKPPN